MFYFWLTLAILTGVWGLGIAIHAYDSRVAGRQYIFSVLWATAFIVASLICLDSANIITLEGTPR